ncbi:PREDICTED: beta-D-glucosyl crocetin beta-1,6-glucosyltransferase-like [Ipomoea nil]|uniref:beta-D-glucosyl crocetin beta-1,6-glucosyltransferase-like n=1 Tax=Ipomoea nil TaxID=35883 RepID=UPI000901BA7F|nr:PREDICTED: beta-D-glucosyl crocetin beta-1,6-glucosyltransferase-like [Ipomoea nil]
MASRPLHLHDALKKVLKMTEPNFTNLLKTLNLDLLIYDVVQLWAEKVALSLDIPSVWFFTASVACARTLTHMLTNPSAEYLFSTLRLRRYEQTRTREIMNQGTLHDMIEASGGMSELMAAGYTFQLLNGIYCNIGEPFYISIQIPA